MKTPRQLTVEALCRIEKEQAWSSLALDSVLTKAKLSVQDRGFASALLYGTLTRQYTIDACIRPLSNRPLAKLDSIVLNILRTGFFQLLYLDSVPDHAAVNESVELCRKTKKTSASGFVNAVLRGFLRTNKSLPSSKNKSVTETLALEYSCPPDLVKYWISAYGEQSTLTILKNSLKAPPTFIRVNPLKTTTIKLLDILAQSDIVAHASDQLENCIVVGEKRIDTKNIDALVNSQPTSLKPKRNISPTESDVNLVGQGAIHQLEAYHQGLFHIQDLSSQRAAESLGAKKGERILDCCAAPGGKTFVIAGQLADSGEIIACDIYPNRTDEIRLRNQRLGFKNINPLTLDMTEYHPNLGKFDRVLCDAPCSGLGTIRRRPEIKYAKLDSFNSLPALQLNLLENASKYCKKGGILVYSTCTLSPKENNKVVDKFLNNNPNFSLTSNGQRTILLGETGGDGFYIAHLKAN